MASFQCRLDSTEAVAWASCSSPKSYSALTDGSHKFEVRAIDQAGNVDQSAASFSWTVDTTAPDTSIGSSPPALTNSAAASFSFSGTDTGGSGVASFQCRIDSTEAAAWGTCTSPKSYSALADGSHKFEVRAIDVAGNIDQSAASSTWTVDTTAPDTAVGSSPPALTNSAAASFSFSGTDVGGSGVASFQCRLDSTQAADWAACTSPKTYASLTDGSHKFEVRAIDVAGNIDPSPASVTWTVDTTAPDTSIGSSPPALTNSAAASFSFSGTDVGGSGGASFQCRLDSTQAADWASCTSPKSYASLADGSHKFEVRAIDVAGNTDASPASVTWTVDTTAPDTSIGSSPPALTNSAAASFSFSGTDTGGSGVTSFQCRLDSNQEAAWASCTSPKTYASLTDGSHKFEVRAIDVAGNIDQSAASFSWTVDTTAPNTSVDASPPALTNTAAASFSFSGTDTGGSGVASFQCRIDSNQEAAWASCTSPKTYASLTDGSHKFEVRAIDQAGNVDQSAASSTWTVDTTAPDTAIGSSPPTLTNSAAASFSFSGTDTGGSGVASFQCRLDSNQEAAWASCTSPKSYSSLVDGSHKFEVRAIDQAGNVDQSAASSTWTVDTTAPDTSIGSSPPALTNSAAASFSFSGADTGGSGVASFQCRIDSTEAAAWTSCSSPKSYSALTDGSHKFDVRAIDQAGNVDQSAASSTWTVDTTAPNTSDRLEPAGADQQFRRPASRSRAPTPADPASRHFQCRIDSTEAAAWGACSSPKSYSALTDGSHKFEVRAIDQAGNIDQSAASSTWTVDTTAPDTSIGSSPPALTNSAAASFSFSGTDTGGSGVASFQCRIDSTEAAAWGTCTSPKSYSSLTDGSHKFEVRAIDQAGNIDQSAAGFSWTVDTTAPNTSVDSSPPALTNSAAASFSFSGTDVGGSGVASFQCRIDSTEAAAWGTCTSPKSYASLADGSHKFEVRAIDVAGNIDQSAASSTWTVDTTPPTVSIDSGPSGLTNDSTPTFTFSSEAGASFECSIDTGAPSFGACSGSGTHSSASPLGDGPYTFRVRATDAATNPAIATQSFTVDTTAPSAPQLTETIPASPANQNAPKVVGTAPAGSTVSLYTTVDCSGPPIATTSAAALAAGVTVSVADDTTTRFRATVTDEANNPSSCSSALTYVEDSTPPQTQIDSNPPGQSGSAGASFAFSGTDAGGSGVASFQCRIDSTEAAAWGTCTSPKSYSSLADGSHKFEVRAIDQAGNIDQSAASFSWTVDTAAPNTSIGSSPATLTNSAAASFSFSGSDTGGSGVAGFQCRLDSTQAADWAACSSPKSYSGLTDGSHKFEVRAIDQAGNVDQTPASFTWTVDTTAPDTSIGSSPPALTNSPAASFSFSGTDTGGSGVASFQCRTAIRRRRPTGRAAPRRSAYSPR